MHIGNYHHDDDIYRNVIDVFVYNPTTVLNYKKDEKKERFDLSLCFNYPFYVFIICFLDFFSFVYVMIGKKKEKVIGC